MLESLMEEGPLIIAGPCALESREQLQHCVAALRGLGVRVVRASLWKPRTRPGWEGLGALGLNILLEETIPHGMIPATEIITPDHARLVVEAVQVYGDEARMLVWLGARNQNHLHQQEIAQILAHGPPGIVLMAKNQMWHCHRHWVGIVEHLLAAGLPKERLLLCHRGFAPGQATNTRGLRNLPDYEMAMQVSAGAGVPMLLDPSHIGGRRDLVLEVVEEAGEHGFDGMIIEVHADPDEAVTDSQQQLSIEQFGEILPAIAKLRRGAA